MGNFVEGILNTLNNEFNRSITENGAVGYRTTGREILDLNFTVSSLRNATDQEIEERFAKAFFEDRLMAIKWLFYARDVRGGLGERRLFRICITSLAKKYPDYVVPVLSLIPEYGRWDDLWCLLDTKVSDQVIEFVSTQLADDLHGYSEKRPISLLAKWMPRHNTSSKTTRYYSKILRNGLHMTVREYSSTLRDLCRHLVVVEQQMSAGEWDEIDYQHVPSRANLQYNNAFLRHDGERRAAFLSKVKTGEAKINASVLFPHDIVSKYKYVSGVDDTLEALWNHLPNTVEGCGNTIVVADGSGSMKSRLGNTNVSALDVANALAIYFAERSSGQFKDRYITFSHRPKLVDLSHGNNLMEKLEIAKLHHEVANTNIEAVFDLILVTAIKNHMEQSELPSNILIISDMEFDSCATWGGQYIKNTPRLFDVIAQRYAEAGYTLPRLVFWNVCSRTMTLPVTENELGVALVSGFSVNVAKMVMSGQLDPYNCLMDAINTERYKPIEDALCTIIC